MPLAPRNAQGFRSAALRRCESERELEENLHPPHWRNPDTRGALRPGGRSAPGLRDWPRRMPRRRRACKVALIERDLLGGDCLNFGCVPSKALIRSAAPYAEMRDARHYGAPAPAEIDVDFAAAMQRMLQLRARLSRDDFAAHAAGSRHRRVLRPCPLRRRRPAGRRWHAAAFRQGADRDGRASPTCPTIPGLDEAGYFNNETIFGITELPRRLLVIGGGPLGCELAQAFRRFGSSVDHRPGHAAVPAQRRARCRADPVGRICARRHRGAAEYRSDRVREVDGENPSPTCATTTTVSSVVVDAMLTGTGRVPAIDGMGLDAAGVEHDADSGIHVDDFLRTSNPRDLCRRRCLPGAQVHPCRGGHRAHGGRQCAARRAAAPERTDDSVVHLHRSRDRPRRPVCARGDGTADPGVDLHHSDARRGSRRDRWRRHRLRQDPCRRWQRPHPRRDHRREPCRAR